MSAISKIQWTDRTWNPVRGCSIVSPGCVNCYAMKQAHRFSGEGRAYHGLTKQTSAGPQWTGKIRTVSDALLEPLSWRKPARVFVNSMSDLFHEDVPDVFIVEVFATMALAHRHTFQILTKRPERMRQWFAANGRAADVAVAVFKRFPRLRQADVESRRAVKQWPLPNVWLGVSAEDQQRADERIPLLLQTPAAVRFVSAEPLLGPIDLERVPLPGAAERWYELKGVAQPAAEKDTEPDDWKYWTRRQSRLDWVIVGGESGLRARPCHTDWIADVVAQCGRASVPCFVKQLGANGYQLPGGYPLRDRKGGDPSEWPDDLRVREFPAVSR